MNFKLSFSYIIGLCSFCICGLNAQINEGGFPPSFKYKNILKSAEIPAQIPVNFNVEDLKMQDAWRVSQGAPLTVATLIKTQLGIDNSGSWTTLPGGEKIWRLNIQAKGATALMLYYKEFYIPEGGKLFIYNANQSQVIGAYTSKTNPNPGKFATEFVAGDDIILEYVAAKTSDEPRIQIEDIGYGYNNMTIINPPMLESSSGSCQVNINCDEGGAWQEEKNGICRMIQRIGTKTYVCTGSLVNNTAQDFKPYILSAYHCSVNELYAATKDNFDQWIFYFNYEKRTCSNASLAKPANTMVGCQRIAASPLNGGSDGLLLLLNDTIPVNYNVYYNGWDRTNTPAQSGVGIHHPSGDYKKISTFTNPAIHMSWNDDSGNSSAEKSHWNVTYIQTKNGYSVPEGGSSGSPLFNQHSLIVGTLSGGSSSCDNGDGLNLYGKLYAHWDHLPLDTNRMDVWLDPINTGVTTLNGRYHLSTKSPPVDLSVTYANQNVEVKWATPDGSEAPLSYNIYKNNVLIENVKKDSYTDADPESGSQTYSVCAVYADGNLSATVYKSIFISSYLPPINVKATRLASNDVSLIWAAPEYEQTIFWGNGVGTTSSITFEDGRPFYFAQLWTPADISILYKKKIKAVKFFPIESAEYSIVIIQGDRKYTQKVVNPVYNQLNSIELESTFVIDNTIGFIVSIYVSKYGKNVYPAACDGGPAVRAKGNSFSFDGIKWDHLYNNIDKDSLLNNNFIVQAVISSNEGTIPTKNITYSSVNEINNSTEYGQIPSPFLNITGYDIYRKNIKINTFPVADTKYTDKNVPSGSYNYSVVAVYGNNESAKSIETGNVAVGNMSVEDNEVDINPTLFEDQVNIQNASLVKQLEILSINGKIVEKITYPSNVINTAHLQSGVYIFRLYTDKEIKIIKAVKK